MADLGMRLQSDRASFTWNPDNTSSFDPVALLRKSREFNPFSMRPEKDAVSNRKTMPSDLRGSSKH